ncbi:MAG TPA: hypothetical protein ENH82_12210 [bacterium]|nr:hypothetical protein [bacterium]
MTQHLTIEAGGNVGISDSSPSYKLDVNGTGRFTGNLYGGANVQNLSFASGFQGDKWQITEDGDGEFENIFIRGGLTAWELIINRLHYQSGGLIIGAGGGKIATIEDATVGAEVVTFEDPEGNLVLPFTEGAIVLMQDFDLNRTTVIKKIVRQVNTINSAGTEITFQATAGWVPGGGNDDTGIFAIGDEVVAIGHTSDANLDASLYMSAVDSDNPFLRILDGVSTYAKWSLGDKTTIKLQLGNLASLANYDIVPAAPGFGLYCDNAYLSGTMVSGGDEHSGDDYSTTGITLAADGSLHTPNFYVNVGGEIGLRQVESVLFAQDTGQGIKISGKEIWENELDDDASGITINFHGYNFGDTRYRQFNICNGQSDLVLVAGGKIGTDKFVEITGSFDVDGNIRSTETKYWSCSGLNFGANTPDVSDVIINNASGSIIASAADIGFTAPVFLPNGAIISAVEVFGNGAAAAETWELRRSTLSAGSAVVLASANINTQDTSISNATVDNNTYHYFFNTSTLDTSDEIYGARIIYTL